MKEEYREALDWLRSCESDQLAGSDDPACSYVASQLGLVIELTESCAVDPIPLSERKPGPEDCLEVKNQSWTMHYCWLGYSMLHAGIERAVWQWRGIPMGTQRGWEAFTHWLPASTKYLPARVE